MSVSHETLTGLQLHEPWTYIQEGDPGAGQPGSHWLKVSTAEIRRRKDDDSGWDVLGGISAADAGTIADTEAALAVGIHAGLTDPHTGYLKESTVTADGQLLIATASGVISVVDVSGPPADGDVITWDSGSTPKAAWMAPAGGGGGASIDSNVYASLPAAGTAGNVYMPTDAPVVLRDDGAAWQAFGPVFPLKLISPPTTWLNQNTATITTDAWGHFLYGPNNGSTGTISIRGREMAYPGTPFTLDVFVVVVGIARDFMGYMPIMARDSGTGRIITFGNARGRLEINQWTSTTAFSSSVLAVETSFPSYPIFYRLVDDGVNHTFYVSADGQHWVQYLQQSRTAWLASPDKIGFVLNNQTGFFSVGMTVLHWYVH